MRAVLIVVAVSFVPTLAVAQMTESEQRQACMGDAFRLCATDIPDRQAVRACMIVKQDQLSPSCKVAFERVGSQRPSY